MNTLNKYKIATLLYVSMFFSLAVFMGVFYMFLSLGIKPALGEAAALGEMAGIIRILFYFLSAAVVFSVKFVDKHFFNMVLSKEELAEQNFIVLTVIKGALIELCGLLGFVLFVLTSNTMDFYLLFLLSFFALVINFPKKQAYEDFLSHHKNKILSGAYNEPKR